MPAPPDDLDRLAVVSLMDEALLAEVRALRTRPRVLVVDGGTLARDVAAHLGAPVDAAADVTAARRYLRPYALVVVNLGLPGAEALAQEARDLAAVALYTDSAAEEREAALEGLIAHLHRLLGR